MRQSIENHPCFSRSARHRHSRVHLPVAPRCNMQCNFCDRKFDCMNESRPGVTSGVLNPQQALAYLDSIAPRVKNLSVVGIAGPGDPMANPEQTMETLRLVRREYPEMLLCLATNGLNLPPYLDELERLSVSHVTITVNAVDPEIGERIYHWMRYGKRVHSGVAAARELLNCQLASIRGLKERGILAKVNCILMQGINDHHVEEVARTVAECGADVFNLMPLIPVPGTPFEHISEPGADFLQEMRRRCGQYLPQMTHCSRCRADAAGLIGEKDSLDVLAEIRRYQNREYRDPEPQNVMHNEPRDESVSTRPYVAVASREGALINLHLGAADRFTVYTHGDDGWRVHEQRMAPPPGYGDQRWQLLAETLHDCRALFVSSAGSRPIEVLQEAGLPLVKVEGLIQEVLSAYEQGRGLSAYIRRDEHACGSGCGGTGGGCG
ncbi:MAG: nitrogenase cofactor biosynthesis protein NifB [Spirochaeta sp.]